MHNIFSLFTLALWSPSSRGHISYRGKGEAQGKEIEGKKTAQGTLNTMDTTPLVTSGPLPDVIRHICSRIHLASSLISEMKKTHHISPSELRSVYEDKEYYEGRLFDILYQLFLCYYQQYEKDNVAQKIVKTPEEASIVLLKQEITLESGAVFCGVPAVFNRTMKVNAMTIDMSDHQRYLSKGDFYLYDFKKYVRHFGDVIPSHILEGLTATTTRFTVAGYLMKNRVQ